MKTIYLQKEQVELLDFSRGTSYREVSKETISNLQSLVMQMKSIFGRCLGHKVVEPYIVMPLREILKESNLATRQMKATKPAKRKLAETRYSFEGGTLIV